MRKNPKEKRSIPTIIRLLMLEAGIALLILYISLRYGEGPTIPAIIGLSIIPVVNIFTAFGLWKFRDKMWVRRVAIALVILILILLSIVVQAIFPLIILAVYNVATAFVLGLIALGLILVIISWIKATKRKKSMKQ